ncbi:MAG: hypothetical protein DRO06_00645, partial [Thermoproteota archaeon]
PEIPPGGSVSLTFSAVALDPGEWVNSASVLGAVGSARVIVEPRAGEAAVVRASLRKVPSTGPEGVIYTIVVESPTGARGLRVEDVLPPEVGYVPGSSVVAGAPAEPAVEGGILQWVVDVPPGGSLPISFKVRVSPGVSGDLVNLAGLPDLGVWTAAKISWPPPYLLSAGSSAVAGSTAVALMFPLLILWRRGRRGQCLLDSISAGVVLDSPALGRLVGRPVVLDITLIKMSGDPTLAAVLADMVSSGEVEVMTPTEEETVAAMALAREGVPFEQALMILVASTRGVRLATSDPLVRHVARGMGIAVVELGGD